jgi:hypothetical protein
VHAETIEGLAYISQGCILSFAAGDVPVNRR